MSFSIFVINHSCLTVILFFGFFGFFGFHVPILAKNGEMSRTTWARWGSKTFFIERQVIVACSPTIAAFTNQEIEGIKGHTKVIGFAEIEAESLQITEAVAVLSYAV